MSSTYVGPSQLPYTLTDMFSSPSIEGFWSQGFGGQGTLRVGDDNEAWMHLLTWPGRWWGLSIRQQSSPNAKVVDQLRLREWMGIVVVGSWRSQWWWLKNEGVVKEDYRLDYAVGLTASSWTADEGILFLGQTPWLPLAMHWELTYTSSVTQAELVLYSAIHVLLARQGDRHPSWTWY